MLRDDGVVWLNLGDNFASSGGQAERYFDGRKPKGGPGNRTTPNRVMNINSIAQGNLMMMPHRVAIALQDDGWIIRNDVVWYKRNPMPESVNGWRFQEKPCDCGKEAREEYLAKTMENKGMERHHAFYEDSGHRKNWNDPNCPKCQGSGMIGDSELRKGSWRHTRAHEYVFQLTKQMGYWSNQEAVREGYTEPLNRWGGNIRKEIDGGHIRQDLNRERNMQPNKSGRNPRSVLDVPQYTTEELWKLFVEYMTNPADVLDIPTAPYKGAHYATFPPNLIAPLIRATCPRWACPICGQGWSPVVEKEIEHTQETHNSKYDPDTGWAKSGWKAGRINSNVKEYRRTCDHPHTIEEAVPGIVLDPFVGSGTTVQVAKQLLRRGVGLDISMDYLDEQAKIRTGAGSPTNVLDDLPMFAQMEE